MSHDAQLIDEPARIAALNRLLVLDTPPEEQFEKITSLIRAVLDVPIAAVSLIDVDRQWFKSIQGFECIETPRDISFCTHTITARSALNVGDTHADPRFCNNPLVINPPHIRAYLGSPLMTSDGYNVGALCVIDMRKRDFLPQQVAMLATFAALVVDELELRLIAHCDVLTGAMSRRAFLERVEAQMPGRQSAGRQMPGRSSGPSTLAILDIDFFKAINDRYGHPVGDTVLRHVVTACQDQLGPGDVIGRLGGEEFGVLFNGRNLMSAHAAVERLRMAIAAIIFDFESDLRVTASFGLSELRPGTLDVVMSEADAALYMAKRQGRNRCCSFGNANDAAIPDRQLMNVAAL